MAINSENNKVLPLKGRNCLGKECPNFVELSAWQRYTKWMIDLGIPILGVLLLTIFGQQVYIAKTTTRTAEMTAGQLQAVMVRLNQHDTDILKIRQDLQVFMAQYKMLNPEKAREMWPINP